MKTLTIEHLKGYLGTNLIIKNSNTEMPLTGAYLDELSDPLFGFDNSFKPLLYPLSSLIEFREDLGFVPIEEFLKTKCKSYFDNSIGGKYLEITNENNPNYVKSFFTYSALNSIDIWIVSLKEEPYWVIQKLYEWHFDIHGLIEQGLAIDKSKLK